MDIKCVGVGLQSKGREVGRCLNEYHQSLTFNQDLSDQSNVELHKLAADQFSHYQIITATVSASDPSILHVVYTVDSGD